MHTLNRSILVIFIIHLVCLMPAQAQEAVSGDENIIIPGTAVELLFDGAVFTEGPAVAPDGKVYFSDITRTSTTGMQPGHIWVYDPETGETSIFRSPSGMSNGIIFDRNGDMIVAEGADTGGRRITKTDMNTGKSVILAGLFNGGPFNSPNDVAIDQAGHIYFTDPRYYGYEPIYQPVQGVYRIDPDRTVSLIIADRGKPNGVIVSPDQQTLYVAELDHGTTGDLPEGVPAAWGNRGVYAYDLDADGNVKFREKLIDLAPRVGVDGMAIDEDGNIYATVGNPSGVAVYSPQGEQLAFIPTPFGVTNVTFGRGSEINTLYITSGGGLYKIKVKARGFHSVIFE